MREAEKGFENIADLKRQLARRALIAFGIVFLGTYALINFFLSLFRPKDFEVYDPRTNTVYVTDDPGYAQAIRRQAYSPSHQYGGQPGVV